MRWVRFSFALLALLPLAACQKERAPSRVAGTVTASTFTVLRGVRLIDGSGRPVVENATLVVSDAKIVAVGPSDQVPVPSGATIQDLTGKTVVPGLISNHSHLGPVSGTTAGPQNYTRANILRQLAQFEAYGVTTVTSLGLNGPLFYDVQRDMRDGKVRGSDLFGADRGLGVPDGAPPVKVDPNQLYRPATADEARQMVRESAERGPSLLKIWVDDFHGTLPAKMAPEVYQAIIDEAHRAHLRVAAHIYYLEDAKRLVAAGIDVLAHGVRDRDVDEDFIRAMKAHGTWYIPTLQLDESSFIYAQHPAWMDAPFFTHALQPALAAEFGDPTWRTKTLADTKQVSSEKQALAVNQRNLKALEVAGVRIGFGTDSGATPLRIPGFAEHRELALMVEAGISPLEAITIATSRAAALLNLEDRGVLAPGKLADFVVVDGKPDLAITDIDHIVSVWQRGKPVANAAVDFTP
jgi:imidazolonepropionase-like amidohydrolase